MVVGTTYGILLHRPSGGLRANFGTDTNPLHVGLAASAGLVDLRHESGQRIGQRLTLASVVGVVAVEVERREVHPPAPAAARGRHRNAGNGRCTRDNTAITRAIDCAEPSFAISISNLISSSRA